MLSGYMNAWIHIHFRFSGYMFSGYMFSGAKSTCGAISALGVSRPAAAVRTSELCRPATSHAVAGKQ